MLKTLGLLLCFGFALPVGAAADVQLPPSKPAQDQPAPPSRPEPPGQPVNVRIELAITDQLAGGEPLKKSITMLAADRARSSVRNEVSGRGFLNADAQPHILPSGAIRIVLGLEYMPSVASSGAEAARTLSRLNEQVTVVLESGKPLAVSQAADPTSDRRVTVQVTATVVR